MPSSDPAQRFADILDNIELIRRFTAGMDLQAFIADEQCIYAVKHALLIISEAAQKLGDIATTLAPDVPWPDVRGIGNRLRHEYDTIDVVRIWLLVERELAPMQGACEGALQSLGRPPLH